MFSIEEEEEKTDWRAMFFDRAVNVYGNRAGTIIIFPHKKQYPISVKLHFECTNNTVDYEACILGLKAASELKIRKIYVYGDSILIIYQVKGEWQTKKEKLRPYQEYLSKLAKEFEEIEFTRIGREMNHFADVLATLAAMATNELRHKVQLVHIDIRNYPAHCCSIKGEICHNPFLGSFKLHSLFLKKKKTKTMPFWMALFSFVHTHAEVGKKKILNISPLFSLSVLLSSLAQKHKPHPIPLPPLMQAMTNHPTLWAPWQW